MIFKTLMTTLLLGFAALFTWWLLDTQDEDWRLMLMNVTLVWALMIVGTKVSWDA